MIDKPTPGVGRDDETRHAQAVAVLVHFDGNHVIVKPTPVIPSQEDRAIFPIRPVHDGVNQLRDVGLSRADLGRRMLADVG